MIFLNILMVNLVSIKFITHQNIVLMGRKSYFQFHKKFRPLSNQNSICLTRDPELIKISPIPSTNLNSKFTIQILQLFYKLYK
jgi:dihydrofolate reductase